jgi:glycosyltransferase involved in cell wall biosynthesis
MAAYNHAPFIGEAIKSVLEQSFHNFELIITDDGSTDGTPDVIRGFSDPRIDLEVFPVNQGACEATNRCIERARGEYIAVINSDDFFLPGKLERQVAILDAEPELGAVFGLPQYIDEAGEPIDDENNPFHRALASLPADRFAWLRHFFLQGNMLCHPTVMIRRRIYDELGNYNVSLRQLPDFDMWVRVCAHYPIHVVQEPFTAFRVLNGLKNTSAPSPSTITRGTWEFGRVLRRYRLIEEATLQRAFAGDIPQEVAVRGLPMWVQLAFLATTRSGPQLQLYALETLEEAVSTGVPGVGPKDLHKLSGELDLFRLHKPTRKRLSRRVRAWWHSVMRIFRE